MLWKKKYNHFSILILGITITVLLLGGKYLLDRAGMGIIGLPFTEISGLEIATKKYNSLKKKYPEYVLNGLMECKSENEVIYDIRVGGGFGGGERYVYSQTGKEVWYRLCETAPNDDCDVVAERGTPPNFSEHVCQLILK